MRPAPPGPGRRGGNSTRASGPGSGRKAGSRPAGSRPARAVPLWRVRGGAAIASLKGSRHWARIPAAPPPAAPHAIARHGVRAAIEWGAAGAGAAAGRTPPWASASRRAAFTVTAAVTVRTGT